MNDVDPLSRALDKLASDQSPRMEAMELDEDERAMLHMAQLIRGSQVEPPRQEFVETLHGKLFPAQPHAVSRRTAFFSGVGALAAGLLAGLGIERATQQSGHPTTSALPTGEPLVSENGRWFHVANLADVPNGAVHPFTAGAVQGFLINQAGNIRGMSRICTHMGCALNFDQAGQQLVCPCHGAFFDMHGQMAGGPGLYSTVQLPPLPRVQVRVSGDKIEVLGV